MGRLAAVFIGGSGLAAVTYVVASHQLAPAPPLLLAALVVVAFAVAAFATNLILDWLGK